MITVYHLLNGKIAEHTHMIGQNLPDEPIWIDLLDPTAEEERALPQELNISLPRADEMWKNHALNQMYTKDGNSYMNASVLTTNGEFSTRTSTITFILTPDFLITIRKIDPSSFLQVQEALLLSPKKYQSSNLILEALVEALISRLALRHEKQMRALEKISETVFSDQSQRSQRKDPTQYMRNVLGNLNHLADTNIRVQETLSSLQRLLTYYREVHNQNEQKLNRTAETLQKHCRSLSELNGYLSTKINFQLETILGLVNVEQNVISKLFSVVTLIFLPPTLVAGVYGMNFSNMPELNWPLGYGFALFLMIIVSIVPYAIFKRRGWL